MIPNPLFATCGELVDIIHFLYECLKTHDFWHSFSEWLHYNLEVHNTLETEEEVLVWILRPTRLSGDGQLSFPDN